MCGSNVDVLKLFLVLHSIHNLILLWNHQNTWGQFLWIAYILQFSGGTIPCILQKEI